MIQLKEVAYVRIGTLDLESTCDFASRILGLRLEERFPKGAQFRSDARAQALTYVEGDPSNQVVAFEVASVEDLDDAASVLDALGRAVEIGTQDECSERRVKSFIAFKDPSGNRIELAVRPAVVSRSFRPTRDISISGLSHVGLFTTDSVRDEHFWTEVCNARVSDRIGDVSLLRINAIHHAIALAPAKKSGIHHVNHQVSTADDVMRAFYFMSEQRVPVVFGPGRHPTSGARFLYFRGPDNLVYEYSCGVNAIPDEANHRPRQFHPEPSSVCMWGSRWNESGWLKAPIGI